MKKRFLIILSAVLAFGLTSCQGFLDKAPLEELSDASFWKSVDDAQRYTGDFYRSLPGSNALDGDISSDDIVHGIKWAEGTKATAGLYDPLSESWDYSMARKTNLLLAQVDLVPNITPEQKNELIAEARFFRARFYAGMIRSYGDVPYVDKPLALDELQINRTPIKEVYGHIVADLEFAAAHLGAKPRQVGRLTKGAALTLLAETQIYFAGFTTGMGSGLTTYAEAAATAKRVMDLGVYDLWDKGNAKGNYAELFWEVGNGSNEVILAHQYINNSGLEAGYVLGWNTFPKVGWGGVNPTQSLVDAFEDSEGALLKDSKIYDPTKPYLNRDPRFEVNILYHGAMMPKWGGPFKTTPKSETKLVDGNSYPTGIGACGDATATGYNQRKWVDQNVTIAYANNWSGCKEHPIWRYAEVLLWFAEAENEANGPTAAAFDAINLVRARVGQPLLQNSDATLPTFAATKEAFRERVRNEYRVELCLEGKRYSAIRRWRQPNGQPLAMKVMNERIVGMPYDEATDTPFIGENIAIPGRKDMSRFQEHNIFNPIPEEERKKNGGITQNDGY